MSINGVGIPSINPRQAPRGSGVTDQKIHFAATLRRILSYLPAHKWQLILVCILTLIATLFSVISPKLLGSVTSSLQTTLTAGQGVDVPYVLRTLVILAVLYVVCFVLEYACTHMMVGVSQRIIRTMRSQINQKLSRLPLRYYDAHAYGDVMSRASNDVDLLSQTLQATLTQLVSASVTLVGITVMMLTISPLLTLICVVTLPAGTAINTFIVRKSHRYFRRSNQTLGKLNGLIEETLTGHHIVRAFSHEDAAMQRFDEDNRKLFRAATISQLASGTSYPLNGIVTDLAYIAICGICGFSVLNGTMPLGDVQAMIQYSQKFATPIGTLSGVINSLQSAFAGAERVFELLDEEEESKDITGALPRPLRGSVRFRDVSFSYTPNKPLIEHFDLNVNPGDVVAIVGHTGAGKTTLVNLLLRFYDVQKGCIELDGQDIRSVPREELRKHFGMVLQDAFLFEGSVRDNICYGARGKVTEEAMRTAARMSFADTFINHLPDSYDTVLTGDSGDLSQGQKQLLTIARALVSDPDVLLLDEATSSVDTRTEQLLQQAMETLMQGRTCFIIAHRLSTIRHAKTILVMDKGSIVEQGDHAALMKKRGVYYDLLNAQFEGTSESK